MRSKNTHPRKWLVAACFGSLVVVSALALIAATPQSGLDTIIDGLTEPFHTIDVASGESGIITKLAVREGETVRQGQVFAVLDNEIFTSALAIAQKTMTSQGGLQSAAAELQLRQDRLEKLEVLRTNNHARQEEVDRARAELAIAQARLLTVQEELEIKKLEYEKIKAQLDRRTIRAPADGVISRLHKDEGESVALNDPVLLTLVQLDPLLASFSVPRAMARDLRVGQKFRVGFPDDVEAAEGTIDFVSPVTDAESGTVRVKVRLENRDGAFRSGDRCTLDCAPAAPGRPIARTQPAPSAEVVGAAKPGAKTTAKPQRGPAR